MPDVKRNPIDSPSARRYLQAADRFSDVMRKESPGTVGQFLREIDVALATLYSAGAELPELEPDTSDVPEAVLPKQEYERLQGSLAAMLGRFDPYRDIFDPSDPEDREPVQYRLSLDLLEILEDLDYGRSLLDPARGVTPTDAMWQWRFAFSSHWGRHAASAIKVVNNLLYTQFVETLEEGLPDA